MRTVIIRSIVAACLVLSAIAVAAPAAASSNVEYAPPVDAPISDPFRPPVTPYGPGNRGIEYATAPGTPVRAAGDGTVTFAGVVASKRWITIRHDDGVRTTYGPMVELGVVVGDRVRGGDVIGTTAGALTFTARVDDAYIDPASLFAGGPPRVRLVREPLDLPQLRAFDHSSSSFPGADAIVTAFNWELQHLESMPSLVMSLTPAPVVTDAVAALEDWHEQQGHCTSSSQPVPVLGQRHVAVLVSGLGSSSDNAAIADVDTSALGYADDDVERFSYAGGPTYDATDTVGDIGASGHRLAEVLIDAVAGTRGPVDVIAHSMGGLVARVALNELAVSRPDVLRRLGTVITLGTPHQGADLAGLVTAVNAQPIGHVTLEAIQGRSGLPTSADDQAVQQLAPGSAFLRELAAHPPPATVRIVSIAARGDVVVPVPRAHLDGATNVVVPVMGASAHDELPGSPVATREIALALNGADPTCETAVDALLDATSGGLISRLEHAAVATQGG